MEPLRIGFLSSLYERVANLETQCFSTDVCKGMLLHTRSYAKDYCRKMKLNIDDTEPPKYFTCQDLACNWRNNVDVSFTTFKSQKCRNCRLYPMKREIFLERPNVETGFVHEMATFIILDELVVMPNVFTSSIALFQRLGIEDMDAVEEMYVIVSAKEILVLLKCSVISKTSLTDLFLNKRQSLKDFPSKCQPKFKIKDIKATDDKGRQIVLKLFLRKSDRKFQSAETNEDYINFIFSFLTTPIGGVLCIFDGCSSLASIDNLHKSITKLSAERDVMSLAIKNMLIFPKCAPMFKLSSQILPIGDAMFGNYNKFGYNSPHGMCTIEKQVYLVDPKSPNSEASSSGGFVKGPSMYMVTDDLVVTPMSTVSVVSYLRKFNISASDMEERLIYISFKENNVTHNIAVTNNNLEPWAFFMSK